MTIKKKVLTQKSFLLSSTSPSSHSTSSNFLPLPTPSPPPPPAHDLFNIISNITLQQQQQQQKPSSLGLGQDQFSYHHPIHDITNEKDIFDDDFVLYKTILIESNISIHLNIIEKYLIFLHDFHQEGTSTLPSLLAPQEKLWRYPNDQQLNQINSLQDHSNVLKLSSKSHILDTIWKISKNQNQRSYTTTKILQEYLLLWQEAAISACELYYNEYVNKIYFLGQSSSSCRIILYRTSTPSNTQSDVTYEALISSCPRSLYIKMREIGLEIFTLVDNSLPSSIDKFSSVPISELANKILRIKGQLSIRLLMDLYISQTLSLHSVSSYHRIVENLPFILTTQYFLHSSLQANTLDSYSCTGMDANNERKISKFQISGYFNSSSIRLLCDIFKKATEKGNDKDNREEYVDMRIQRIKNQSTESNQLNGNGYLDESDLVLPPKLLNPFQLTKSDPIESSITTSRPSVSPRNSELKHVPETPSRSFINPMKHYFHMKLISLQADHFVNYISTPTGRIAGRLMTEVRWNENPFYQIESLNLPACRNEVIEYQQNQIIEEVILN